MGYGDPPWIFTGKALYQLQLVRSKEARKYIPEKLKLVELFGWTLGGFFLARYDSSPAGTFDEMVVMAGLTWNPPTSCAWAARVYVTSKEARKHGVHHVGLPSRFAKIKVAEEPPTPSNQSTNSGKAARGTQLKGSSRNAAFAQGEGTPSGTKGDIQQDGSGGQSTRRRRRRGGEAAAPDAAAPPATVSWWHPTSPPSTSITLYNAESTRATSLPRGLGFGGQKGALFSLPLPQVPHPATPAPTFPRITIDLPSYSGGTPHHPALVKYSVKLRTVPRLLSPVKIQHNPPAPNPKPRVVPQMGARGGLLRSAWVTGSRPFVSWWAGSGGGESEEKGGGNLEVLNSVLSGVPLLGVSFEDMSMTVGMPEVVG